MKLKLTFLRCLLITMALVAFPAQATADESKFSLGLYVVVNDMEASKAFYAKLFESDPYIDTGDFVGFRVSGNLMSLFLEAAFEHNLVRGNNVVPYIRVDDISGEFERIKAFAPKMVHDRVLDEGQIKLFMFEDPSGNPIEFYSIVRQ
jgi:predicted enzyme related to lactoylglutathione lyase